VAEVLIAEEAASHRALAQFVLETQGGHTVRFAHDGGALLNELDRSEPDLVLLEAMLPSAGASGAPNGTAAGMDFCRQLRRRVSLPILMVGQQSDASHRVQGLRAGADDFLPKPWDPDELLERVNALLRRTRRAEMGPSGATIRAGDFRLHLIDRQLWIKERGPIELTPVECRLLYAMLNKPGTVWTREALLHRIGGFPQGYDGPANTVEAHVSRLRRKIERAPKNPQYLRTIRGEGYQLLVTPQAA
jgi:DNA-binding response OmpR family regulator